jgi:hypothetical protein
MSRRLPDETLQYKVAGAKAKLQSRYKLNCETEEKHNSPVRVLCI